ncbi:CHRD domain-containing protein [Streptomyces sp. Wb2n-11]|uniref:CHRD domain-containing protein n=1 Tax=Streptomyces sp. Wb2n-11 TaxID=1030533 RepID=UPI000A517364|nr:CHRD domain-containing protein [Streptomyces sp. Wb2n-11]
MTKTTACALAALATLAPMVALAPSAAADDTSGRHKAITLHATLNPFKVNKVTGSGTAMVHLEGNTAHVTVKHSGLLAGAPHAQHFHIGAKGVCPPESVAKERNGKVFLNTTDGAPFYGGIGTSLTTTGDTSPSSGLAVDRFPVGDKVHYERTITLSDEAAKSLREGTGVVVVHGIDFNGNGTYDNNLGPSDLDPKLPSEATNPALCGPLKMAAKGAVHGGQGGTQTPVNTAAAAAGATLLAGAGAVYGLRRRSARQS